MSSRDLLPLSRPNIDDLVAVARAAGRPQTNRRTIHYWVERNLVEGPVCRGRAPRYSLRTIGQVDALARLPIRRHGIDLVRFALFVETESIPVADALGIAAKHSHALWAALSASREEAARNPEALRAEVERAARLRGRHSVLPREVRMSLEEREHATAQLIGVALGIQIDGVPSGLGALERALGLRSGRGGIERNSPFALTGEDITAMDPEFMHKAVLAATPVRARIARSLTELFFVWFPALVPSLAPAGGVEQKFLDVVRASGAERNPEAYLASFVGLLARQRPHSDERLVPVEKALQPAAVVVEMLAALPDGERVGALSRLRPLQQLKLEAALRVVQTAGGPRR